MAERILVTGVTGLVGRALAPALAAEGYEVHGVSRDPARALREVPALSAVHAPEDVGGRLLSETGGVVSLAGEPVAGRWTAAKRRKIEASRVEGTRAIVEAIAAADPRPEVLVSASAMGFYGPRGEDELTEEEPAGTDFLAEVCVAWEREAERARELGVRVVMPRIGLVLAANGGALEAMMRPFRAGLGGPLGSGRQWWSWIHLDDLVRLLVAMVRDEAMEGAYNAVSPAPIRQADFAKTLGAVLGRPAFMPAPAFALELALGGFSAELLASRRLVPARARARGFGFRHTDLEATLRELVRA
ncbi:MAG: TIGR01777 family oxidoreductase [Sandaracinaceae bacterium]|nr:TIGR01777 family oxidoreductase [Sandaracinaceae bacterium]